MTVTLELKPEIEKRLASQAKAFGLSIEQYLEKIAEERADSGASLAAPETLTPEEKEARHERLIEIVKRAHELPRLDHRTPDEIIGYDEWGLPTR